MLLALMLTPAASAWTWPVDGPVLRPFIAEDDPYAGGQHRGVDVAAPAGGDVRAPAAGVASFVGQLPREGLCLTIRTVDGYSITLVHLGSIGVRTGTAIEEGDVVGTIGPSGDSEWAEPYVHLGIRLTADPHGYVDPLSLLPVRPSGEPQPRPVEQAPTAPAAVAQPLRADLVRRSLAALRLARTVRRTSARVPERLWRSRAFGHRWHRQRDGRELGRPPDARDPSRLPRRPRCTCPSIGPPR